MAATLEPRFEPMKNARFEQDNVAFLDEVKVTEKGSLVGLLEQFLSITLDSHALTPNYSSFMEICAVNGKYTNLALLEVKVMLIVMILQFPLYPQGKKKENKV